MIDDGLIIVFIVISHVILSRRLSRIERILSRTINQQPPDDGGI